MMRSRQWDWWYCCTHNYTKSKWTDHMWDLKCFLLHSLRKNEKIQTMLRLIVLCFLPGVWSGVRVACMFAAVVVTVCANTEQIRDHRKTGCIGRDTEGVCLSVRNVDNSEMITWEWYWWCRIWCGWRAYHQCTSWSCVSKRQRKELDMVATEHSFYLWIYLYFHDNIIIQISCYNLCIVVNSWLNTSKTNLFSHRII